MPYASPTYHRALSHQRHVAPSRSAGSEIDRVVMRVSRDMQAIHDDVLSGDWDEDIFGGHEWVDMPPVDIRAKYMSGR